MQEDIKIDNLISNQNPENQDQIDAFPKTTKLLDKKLKDKKDTILNILNNDELRQHFENALSDPEIRQKLMNELLNSQNNEVEIRGIILANLPEWFTYDVSTGSIVEIQINIQNNDLSRAIIRDNIEEEANHAVEEANYNKENKDIAEETAETRLYRAKQAYDNLVIKYPELVWNIWEKYDAVKQQLENNWILNQLRESDHDEQFINDYVLVQATLVELKSNPAVYDENDISLFDRVVKNLDNACNIPDTSLSSFSNQNLSQTRKELFHESIWNKWLIEQRENNIEKHNSAYENLFRIENDDESIIFNQKEVQDKTKDMVEELCMTSQIKWFLSCIPDNYSENFQFNKANEINVQDGILQLDWHVNWVNFSLRQDTNDVNARLQTSTMLFRDKDDNLDFTWKYKNSPFVLPTATQVFDTAIAAIDKDKLSKIQDQDDYFDTLEKMVLESMNKLYENTKYTHHYLEGEIKSEEVINKTMWIYRQIWWWNIESLSKVTNEKLYNFFDTVEFNLNVMTNKEKQRLLNCMTNLFGKIVEWWDVAWSDQFVKDENLAKFLWSKSQTEKEIKWLWWLEDSKSFFNLFDDFYINTDERNESWNRKIINLSKLIECLDDSQYAQSFWEDINGINVDDWLDQELQMA